MKELLKLISESKKNVTEVNMLYDKYMELPDVNTNIQDRGRRFDIEADLALLSRMFCDLHAISKNVEKEILRKEMGALRIVGTDNAETELIGCLYEGKNE